LVRAATGYVQNLVKVNKASDSPVTFGLQISSIEMDGLRLHVLPRVETASSTVPVQ
jgi:hypothetical protein